MSTLRSILSMVKRQNQNSPEVMAELCQLLLRDFWPEILTICITLAGGIPLFRAAHGIVAELWIVCGGLAAMARLGVILCHRRQAARLRWAVWLRLYCGSTLLLGIVWALGFPVLIQAQASNGNLGVYFALAACMIGSSALLHAAYVPAMEMFILPIVIVAVGISLSIENSIYLLFSVLMTVFAAIQVVFAIRVNATVIQSISERRHKEELAGELTRVNERLIEANRIVENANQAKSAFLATMSHEMRTPLNTINGFSELMIRQILGPFGNEKYLEYAQDINTSGMHLLALINDVLDLSKVEAGKMKLECEVLNPVPVVHGCVRLLAERALSNGIKLETSYPDAGYRVFADERRLKQIAFNLISNAIKFTPSGGRVVVSLSLEGDNIVLKVSDTGIGIREEDIPRVLVPFQQIDSQIARTHEGTGLGLPLTKTLVDLHNGKLDINSRFGEGTMVSVSLPAVFMAPSETEPETAD